MLLKEFEKREHTFATRVLTKEDEQEEMEDKVTFFFHFLSFSYLFIQKSLHMFGCKMIRESTQIDVVMIPVITVEKLINKIYIVKQYQIIFCPKTNSSYLLC